MKTKLFILAMLILLIAPTESFSADIDRNSRTRFISIDSHSSRVTDKQSALYSVQEGKKSYKEARYLSVGLFGAYNSTSLSQDIDENNNNYIYDSWDNLEGSFFSYGLEIRIRFPENETFLKDFWILSGINTGSLSLENSKANNKQYMLNSNIEYIDHQLSYDCSINEYYFGVMYSIWWKEYQWFSINPNLRVGIINVSDVKATEKDYIEGGALFTNGRKDQILLSELNGLANSMFIALGVEFEFRFIEEFSIYINPQYYFGGQEIIRGESIGDRTGMIPGSVFISNRSLNSIVQVKTGIQYNF